MAAGPLRPVEAEPPMLAVTSSGQEGRTLAFFGDAPLQIEVDPAHEVAGGLELDRHVAREQPSDDLRPTHLIIMRQPRPFLTMEGTDLRGAAVGTGARLDLSCGSAPTWPAVGVVGLGTKARVRGESFSLQCRRTKGRWALPAKPRTHLRWKGKDEQRSRGAGR